MNKFVLSCPCCSDEEIVIDLYVDADRECWLCGYALSIEIESALFSLKLFDLTPISTVH